MVPSIALNDFDVRVLDFEPLRSERGLIVFENAKLDRITYPRVPPMLRLPMVRDEITSFEPQIVHHFYHIGCMEFPFFIRLLVGCRPKYVIDIRSPLLLEDEERREQERERNRLTSSYCDAIFTHAMESATFLIPGTSSEILYAPPGVSLPEFKFKERLEPAPLRKFVYAGSLAPRRKLEELIALFDALRLRSVASITLDIYGDGAARGGLETEVRRRGLSGIVTLRGQVKQEVLANRLGEYDAGICYIPYGNYNDAPALKFIEYAAAGLAVFATDTPALLRNNQAGARAVYFSNNPESFCNAILPWTRENFSCDVLKQNRQYAESQDWTDLVKRDYYPIYHRLAAGVCI
jgi:glycosyltransferase involved in cell wall biosynthesis